MKATTPRGETKRGFHLPPTSASAASSADRKSLGGNNHADPHHNGFFSTNDVDLKRASLDAKSSRREEAKRAKKEKKDKKKMDKEHSQKVKSDKKKGKSGSSIKGFEVEDLDPSKQVVRKVCSAGLNCKSVDASHFLLYQHTPISEEQRKAGIEVVDFDFNKEGASPPSPQQNNDYNNNDAEGEGEGDDDDMDAFSTTVITLTDKPSNSDNATKERCPTGLTLSVEDFRNYHIDFSAPSFRSVEEWELNLIALERGEWVEGQMKDEAFGRYHKKAKGAVKELFSNEEERKREKERLVAARERLLSSMNNVKTVDKKEGEKAEAQAEKVVYGRTGASARGAAPSTSARTVSPGTPTGLRPSAQMNQQMKANK